MWCYWKCRNKSTFVFTAKVLIMTRIGDEIFQGLLAMSISTYLILYLKVLKPEERERLVENIGNHLINTQKFIQDRAVKNFGQADPEFGRKLQAHLDSLSSKTKVNLVLVKWLQYFLSYSCVYSVYLQRHLLKSLFNHRCSSCLFIV